MYLHYVLQSIFLIAGVTALWASLLDRDWFFNSDNAAFVVKRLGRKKSRWFYGILGILFIASAIIFCLKMKTIG